MTDSPTSDTEAIRKVLEQVHHYWRTQNYEAIADLAMGNVVIAPPGFETRVVGNSTYAQSFAEYDKVATTIEFSSDEPQIDVMGNVAVAVCPFETIYEIQAARSHEKGHDILVMSRTADGWKIAWRTMQTSEIQE